MNKFLTVALLLLSAAPGFGQAIGVTLGAPRNATYITKTADGVLSGETALGSLNTGLLQVTTTTGNLSAVTTSGGVASLISNETGTGVLVFNNAPTILTPSMSNGSWDNAALTDPTISDASITGSIYSGGTVEQLTLLGLNDGGEFAGGPVQLRKPNGDVIHHGVGATTDAERGTALLTAVNTATAGDCIALSAGTFAITSPLLLDADKVTLQGQGDQTVIDATVTNLAIKLYADGLVCRDFKLTSSHAGIGWNSPDADFPVGFDGCTDFVIENITMTGDKDLVMFNTAALVCTGRVTNCRFTNPAAQADALIDLQLAAGSEVVIEGCRLDGFNDVDLYLHGQVGAIYIIRDTNIVGGSTNSIVQEDGVTVTLQNVNYDASIASGTILHAKTFGVTPGATGIALLDDATASAARDTLGASSGTFPLSVGGTGATTAAAARANLGTNFYSVMHATPIGINPAASSTYYVLNLNGAATSAAFTGRVYPPVAGTVTKASIVWTVQNTLASAQTFPLVLMKNGIDAATLTSTVALNGRHYDEMVTNLSVPFNVGDYFELKFTTPAWTTNPTGVLLRVDLWIEY
jgi:hypothetical protein